MSMREAMFDQPWPAWVFPLINTDLQKLGERMGVGEADYFRERVVSKLGELQVGRLGQRLAI